MLNKQKPRGDFGGSTGSKLLRRADIRQGKDSRFSSTAQVCVCADCRYFRLVPLAWGGVRRICCFTGEKLDAGGEPLCEFRQVEGGAA